jgi:hypothetical protein
VPHQVLDDAAVAFTEQRERHRSRVESIDVGVRHGEPLRRPRHGSASAAAAVGLDGQQARHHGHHRPDPEQGER